jgi:hypothetical protein
MKSKTDKERFESDDIGQISKTRSKPTPSSAGLTEFSENIKDFGTCPAAEYS